MRLTAHCSTGPLPYPATHRILPLGGRVGKRAGAAWKCALPRISNELRQVLDRTAGVGLHQCVHRTEDLVGRSDRRGELKMLGVDLGGVE